MANEFDGMYNADDFSNESAGSNAKNSNATSSEAKNSDATSSEAKNSDATSSEKQGSEQQQESTGEGQESGGEEDLVASGSQGLEYDITKAPDNTKGPERQNLDGQTVTITDMKVILPPKESEWQASRDGKVNYKGVRFILFYDDEGQREFYSGMKVFKRVVEGQEKYSDPVIQNNGTNQASELKKAYAKYKGKKPEEISLREFLSFLKSKPKAVLMQKSYEFDGKTTYKNIVSKFVSE